MTEFRAFWILNLFVGYVEGGWSAWWENKENCVALNCGSAEGFSEWRGACYLSIVAFNVGEDGVNC